MSYDEEKVDEMALALMYLSSVHENEGVRAWKTFAWETRTASSRRATSEIRRATRNRSG